MRLRGSVKTFSTFGPLPGEGTRFFPDMVACGDNVVSVKIDVPDLSDDQRNRLGVELRQAARNVGKFRLKIEAPAARTKETPA